MCKSTIKVCSTCVRSVTKWSVCGLYSDYKLACGDERITPDYGDWVSRHGATRRTMVTVALVSFVRPNCSSRNVLKKNHDKVIKCIKESSKHLVGNFQTGQLQGETDNGALGQDKLPAEDQRN